MRAPTPYGDHRRVSSTSSPHASRAIAVRKPGVRTFPGWGPLFVQIVLVGGAALCYFAVRGLTQSSLGLAQENARDLVAVEQWIGLDWEHSAQALIIDHHDRVVWLVDAVYIYGHWPVIIVTLAWLFVRRPTASTCCATRCSSQAPSGCSSSCWSRSPRRDSASSTSSTR